MVGILVSSWDGQFSGAMLVSGRVPSRGFMNLRDGNVIPGLLPADLNLLGPARPFGFTVAKDRFDFRLGIDWKERFHSRTLDLQDQS